MPVLHPKNRGILVRADTWEARGPGSIPALSNRFFSLWVKVGKERLIKYQSKITLCKHTQT